MAFSLMYMYRLYIFIFIIQNFLSPIPIIYTRIHAYHDILRMCVWYDGVNTRFIIILYCIFIRVLYKHWQTARKVGKNVINVKRFIVCTLITVWYPSTIHIGVRIRNIVFLAQIQNVIVCTFHTRKWW